MDSINVALQKGGTSLSYPGFSLKLGSEDWNAAMSDGNQFVHAGFLTYSNNLGTWTFLTVVVDRQSGLFKAYADGVLGESIDISTLGSIANSVPMFFGDNNNLFTGNLDEVRIMKGVVSEDWIRLSYRNQASVDKLLY
jgi:hypothetical protein